MADTYADTILYGGDIITMDDKNLHTGKVEAIAITGSIIVDVGSMERVFSHKGPKTEVIFLNQQTLMPGFIEPHQHAVLTGQMQSVSRPVNIGGHNYRTYAEVRKVMLNTIQNLVGEPTGKWALFLGWDPELISDLPTLSAKFLDENFSTEVAIGVVGQSTHVAWVNSLALSKAGITNTTPDPERGTYIKDEDGNVTGQMYEGPAILEVLGHAPMPDAHEIVESVMARWKYYASVGFTTVTDLAYIPNNDFDKVLKVIASRKDCPIRLGLYHRQQPCKDSSSGKTKAWQGTQPQCGTQEGKVQNTETEEKCKAESIGYFSDKLWEVGIKFVADGSPHCGTAAVRQPYLNTPLTETLGFPPAPCYGMLNFTSEELADSVRRLSKAGKQVAIHCHGERACEQVLKAYEQVLADDPTNTNRHRMEHVGLMTVDQITRAGKINIALSFFVDHLRFYGSVYKTDIFGEDRVNRWTPLSEATKSGITWTIHQDNPSFPGDTNPFANMKTAITRTCRDDPSHPYGPEYCVTIHEALKAYTINAAWQLHLDQHLGTITVGKKADLVVLSENPYHKDPFDLEDINVVETFLEGRRNNLANVKAVAPGINVLQRATDA
ncbi:putative amidohydrolase YtcJ [Amphiura filiformis]|uniref:putative amidohydrolase YtcJ n=1 Tax=Amphiura filiformis TaxID=82378 RepID=UPI003B22091F